MADLYWRLLLLCIRCLLRIYLWSQGRYGGSWLDIVVLSCSHSRWDCPSSSRYHWFRLVKHPATALLILLLLGWKVPRMNHRIHDFPLRGNSRILHWMLWNAPFLLMMMLLLAKHHSQCVGWRIYWISHDVVVVVVICRALTADNHFGWLESLSLRHAISPTAAACIRETVPVILGIRSASMMMRVKLSPMAVAIVILRVSSPYD